MRPSARFALPIVLIAAFALSASVGAAPPDQRGGTPFYGINMVAPTEPWLTLAKETGARTVRWLYPWYDLEPSPGAYVWQYADQTTDSFNAAGLQIHAILGSPPGWAVAGGRQVVPAGIGLPWDDPGNAWGSYCHQFARHFKGRIASYEVWNEPDLDIHWDGSPEEYFQVMKTCYQAIKAADPGPPVVMAGMVLLGEHAFSDTVVRLAATDPQGAANNFYFDAANVHMYVDPELAYSLPVEMRGILSQYGLGYKPIWITETNVAIRGYARHPDTPKYGVASEQENGWYMLQAASNALAAGVDRYMVFRMEDAGMDEAFGLLRADRTFRPAYYSFRLAATFLNNIQSAQREVQGDVVINTLIRSDSARIIVIYARSGQPATVAIPARANAAVVLNPQGTHGAIQATPEGEYVVSLLPAAGRGAGRPGDYSVGGPPVVLYELDQVAPSVVLDVLPFPNNDGLLRLRWRGDDGEAGTGVVHYDVEFQRDDGEWQLWKAVTPDREGIFDISDGGIYRFRVRAYDLAGNASPYSAGQEAAREPLGRLILRIRDVRGQPIPYARATLADGTLHDANAQGIIQVALPPGIANFQSIDGSAQGYLDNLPPLAIEPFAETEQTVVLPPRVNLIPNGAFDRGLQGWQTSSPTDVTHVLISGGLVRLASARQPWGNPALLVTLDLPADMQDAVIHFDYRMPAAGTILRLRAVTATAQQTLWYTDIPTENWERGRADLGRYAGQRLTLSLEMLAPKGRSGAYAEVDSVVLGNVPALVE